MGDPSGPWRRIGEGGEKGEGEVAHLTGLFVVHGAR